MVTSLNTKVIIGLPLTQGNSGNFQIIENLRETQTQGCLRFKKSQVNFFLDLEWDLVNSVSIFDQKK